MRFTFFFASFLIAAAGCFTQRTVTSSNYIKSCPPGTIEIDSNFYCDQYEIQVIDWREYMYWTKRVFGQSSAEYLASIPDTTVWLDEESCLQPRVYTYLFHPKYNYHPIVGISQKQALAYTNWRSDRVFEQILIHNKIIKTDTAPTRDTYFTIKRFYNGELKTYLSEKRLRYYPEYLLPSLQERTEILSKVDSLNISRLKKCKSKICSEALKNYPPVLHWSEPCAGELSIKLSAKHKKSATKHLLAIYALRGGVAEWSNIENLTFGGSWKDIPETILESDTAKGTVSATTGFRNVCRWVIWEDD
jgi:hypothetical protein